MKSCTLLVTAAWVQRFPNTQALTTTTSCPLSPLSAPQLLDSFPFTWSSGLVFRNFEKQRLFLIQLQKSHGSYKGLLGNQGGGAGQRGGCSVFTWVSCSWNRRPHGPSRLPLKSVIDQCDTEWLLRPATVGNYNDIFNMTESSVFENVLCLKNGADKEAPVWSVRHVCAEALLYIQPMCLLSPVKV